VHRACRRVSESVFHGQCSPCDPWDNHSITRRVFLLSSLDLLCRMIDPIPSCEVGKRTEPTAVQLGLTMPRSGGSADWSRLWCNQSSANPLRSPVGPGWAGAVAKLDVPRVFSRAMRQI
jgi:hypothetical protein